MLLAILVLLKRLTIEWGGTTNPNDLIRKDISGEDGAIFLIPGWTINNGLAIRAFAETTNIISIFGFVNRITA